MPVAVERLPALAFQPCGRILFAEFADLSCAQCAIMQSPCDGIKKLFPSAALRSERYVLCCRS